MMALTLAVGFVVDDAIVVLENIARHRERGEPEMQAALLGSREIAFTVVSMTLSLVAVFIPMLMLSGLVGRMFGEFAVTVSMAILVSGFVSLTLTPMLCSRFLNAGAIHGKGAFARMMERIFDAMYRFYEWSLGPSASPRRHAAGVLRGARRDRRDVHHRGQGIHSRSRTTI